MGSVLTAGRLRRVVDDALGGIDGHQGEQRQHGAVTARPIARGVQQGPPAAASQPVATEPLPSRTDGPTEAPGAGAAPGGGPAGRPADQ